MISIEEKGNYAEVVLVGQLEYEKADELISLSKTKLLKLSAATVKLDFSRLNYINSIGIGAIVSVYKILREKNKKMVILKPQDNVLKVLKLMRIDEVISIEGE